MKDNVEPTGVTYTGHLVQGDPRDVISRLADEWNVDAVVCGSHGKVRDCLCGLNCHGLALILMFSLRAC